MVLGQQRLGINLVSLIAALREEARLPWRTIQWYLETVHGLHLSLGAIVDATQRVAQWAQAVHQLYQQARAFTHPADKQRRTAQLALERRLLALCRPYLDDPSAAQSRLCRRIENRIKSLPRTGCGELFVVVAHPEVPPDDNAAERSLRPVVISRKISSGARSHQGTETKMTLASIFGTWRAQSLNPLAACRQLLASPQV